MPPNATSEPRYERKYNLADGRHQDFVNYLFGLEFSRQHQDRVVNSIYFDGADRPAFWDKIEGVSDRTKYRVRWYGNQTGPIDAKLEVKMRRNEVGTKQILPMHQSSDTSSFFEFLRSTSMTRFFNKVGQFNLVPIVQVQYVREYYAHRDKNIRATVDRCLAGAALTEGARGVPSIFQDIGACVMELKYGLDLDFYVRSALIGTAFPFRMQKFSKYSMACGALRL